MPQPGFTNHRIVIGVCFCATLALLPFSIHHAVSGHWYLAGIIGGLNALIGAGAFILYRQRHNTVRARRINYAIVILANLVAVLSIHAQGGQTAYWIYPIIFANFYLLPFAAGTAASVVFAALSLLAAAPSVPPEYLARLLVTTPLCLFFGVVFSLGLTRQRRQLQYLATHDALTGTGNRRALDGGLADAVARKHRYDERCSLVIFDIDEFKAINDSMGHMHADTVIAELAALVSERIRVMDRLYRFGGEEFVLVLPHASARASWQLAEALRMEVEEHSFAGNTGITISAGIAELGAGENAEDWLRRADDALFRAKEGGRNRCMGALDPGSDREEPFFHPESAAVAGTRAERRTAH